MKMDRPREVTDMTDTMSQPGQLLVQPAMAHAELGAQPHRPALPDMPILQAVAKFCEAEFGGAVGGSCWATGVR
jgi:hypothetical protein